MAKIKFMGSSHVHTLGKGDDFGGQLSEGLSKDVTFNRENNWVVDTDDAGLSEAAVKVLTDSGDFKDVSDLDRIPVNEHQKLFLGMKGTEEVLGADAEDKPKGSEPAQGSTETDDTPGTTVGGSTRRQGRS